MKKIKEPSELALRLKMKKRSKRPPNKPGVKRRKPYVGQGRV